MFAGFRGALAICIGFPVALLLLSFVLRRQRQRLASRILGLPKVVPTLKALDKVFAAVLGILVTVSMRHDWDQDPIGGALRVLGGELALAAVVVAVWLAEQAADSKVAEIQPEKPSRRPSGRSAGARLTPTAYKANERVVQYARAKKN
jgi:hypothetical protein